VNQAHRTSREKYDTMRNVLVWCRPPTSHENPKMDYFAPEAGPSKESRAEINPSNNSCNLEERGPVCRGAWEQESPYLDYFGRMKTVCLQYVHFSNHISVVLTTFLSQHSILPCHTLKQNQLFVF
jgi:hypothetical protein